MILGLCASPCFGELVDVSIALLATHAEENIFTVPGGCGKPVVKYQITRIELLSYVSYNDNVHKT